MQPVASALTPRAVAAIVSALGADTDVRVLSAANYFDAENRF